MSRGPRDSDMHCIGAVAPALPASILAEPAIRAKRVTVSASSPVLTPRLPTVDLSTLTVSVPSPVVTANPPAIFTAVDPPMVTASAPVAPPLLMLTLPELVTLSSVMTSLPSPVAMVSAVETLTASVELPTWTVSKSPAPALPASI